RSRGRSAQRLDADTAVFVGVRQMLFEAGWADALVEMTVMGRHADEGQVRITGPDAALKAAVGGDLLASWLLTKARGHGCCSFGGSCPGVPSQRGTDGVRHTVVVGRLQGHYIIFLMKAAGQASGNARPFQASRAMGR